MDNNKFDTEDELHFYYDRTKRLERASETVRSHYDGTEKQPPKGFFKALVHTRTSRFLLSSIILLLVIIVFVWLLNMQSNQNNVGVIHGISFELQAFVFEDTVYVSLKAGESEHAEDIVFGILFSALNANKNPVANEEQYSHYDGTQNSYVTTFKNQNILHIECTVMIADEILILRTEPII